MPYTRPEGIVHVLAPSYQHFRAWCRDNGRRPRQMLFCPEAIYLHTPSKAEGLRTPRVARVDGWEDGRYAREIWQALIAADAVGYPDGGELADLEWPWPDDSSGDVLETLQGLRQRADQLAESLRPLQRPMETTTERYNALVQASMVQPQHPYIDQYNMLRDCPCPSCAVLRARSAQPLPPAPPGQSHVYLADGPSAGQIVALADGYDRYMATDPEPPFSAMLAGGSYGPMLPTGTVYAIQTYGACSQLGPHQWSEVCNQQLRVGFSTQHATPGSLGQYREGALDALLPQWRTLVTGSSPVPAHGRILAEPPMRQPQWMTADFEQQARNFYNQYAGRNYVASTLRQVPAPAPAPADTPGEGGWYRPLSQRELNWTEWDEAEDGTTVCAHVCGGEHQCEARATEELEFTLPTGGIRRMPVCQTCYLAEEPGVREDQEAGR